MRYALCTISFRHQLISFADIVHFARRHGFDGIELWGIHARHLYQDDGERTREQLQFIRKNGMSISMISDYLDISPSADRRQTLEKCTRLIQLAEWFQTRRIRTFAGQKPSGSVTPLERRQYVDNLRFLCDLCKQHHVHLLVETHPNTLTDSLSSTLRLLEEVSHESLKVNLDFLHLWESGDDPLESFTRLKPWVEHYHLKNIASAEHLQVFQPHNVYAPSGRRSGMVPLKHGAVNYREILEQIEQTEHFASLEWFGLNPLRVLSDEVKWLRSTDARTSDMIPQKKP
ncbi:MAG: sugar phosphate isomerase/epimerase [Brevibacillus sp.]|nr:sugar phosphate isomerase/epimerase [Brevibacillus sp.]